MVYRALVCPIVARAAAIYDRSIQFVIKRPSAVVSRQEVPVAHYPLLQHRFSS
jgi:hypothetical protein